MGKQTLFFIIVFLAGGILAGGTYFFLHRPLSRSAFLSPLSQNQLPPPTAFSLENAPRDSLRGQIATMSGEIFWQSRTATEPAKLLTPIILQQGENLIASDGGKMVVNFPADLTISLTPRSQINIIQTLPVNLVFEQPAGTITYEASQSGTISVRSRRLLVNFTDGQVQVNTDSDNHVVTVGVFKGEGKLSYNDRNFTSQVVNLPAGRIFIFNDDRRTGRISRLL